MAVNSNGSDNRIAGRDYQEKNIQIERYDGSHTVNIAIPSSNDSDPRPLVKGQRKALNSLVATIVDASNTEAFIIWQKLHAEIGVDSIDDIKINDVNINVNTINNFLIFFIIILLLINRLLELFSYKFIWRLYHHIFIYVKYSVYLIIYIYIEKVGDLLGPLLYFKLLRPPF